MAGAKNETQHTQADPLPDWLMRPEPVNAAIDEELMKEAVSSNNLHQLDRTLRLKASSPGYDPAVNLANLRVWKFFSQDTDAFSDRDSLIGYVQHHFSPQAKARVFRQLAKSPDVRIRRRIQQLMRKQPIFEVSLPNSKDADWDKTGWFYGLETSEHRPASQLQTRLELPSIATVGELRATLGIRSEKQAGWLCLATDADEGPYTTFAIPKRTGGERKICAPKWQLRRVQEQILHKILYRVPLHNAAHGFVPGRSTVTNAAPHVKSKLLVKFDLKDFFPTIHHYRVVGLFASLGYDFSDGRFSSDDRSNRVAATLARLCMYTPNSRAFGAGHLPQGAPTSPAITNLVCRALDARLTGLATKNGGHYTRYADDLTFSFNDSDLKVGRFRWWVDQICHQEGFLVNQEKFRVIRDSQQQSVTGIVVNDCLRVPRRQRRQFRAILHNCRVHGVESQARGNVAFGSWMKGFASYINMVHPEEGAELLAEVNEILSGEGDQA